MTEEDFAAAMTSIRTGKHKSASELMQQYGAAEKKRAKA